MTRNECIVTYYGKKFQTKVITHDGFRRILKWSVTTKDVIKDDIKLFKNHPKDCIWCKQ